MEGNPQVAPDRVLVSEIGLEFTRLSQLTGDPKYYDAIQRIGNEFEKSQSSTKLPGMWPVSVDAATPSFSEDNFFTLGGMSDSLYEYFPKQYLLLGGLLAQPRTLYENFIEVAKKEMFFGIPNPQNLPLLHSGDVRVMREQDVLTAQLHPRGQHLTCFTGGMVGLSSRIFDRPDDMHLAEELTAGCVWAYDINPHGIAPEVFNVVPCHKTPDCTWSEKKWHDAITSNYVLAIDVEPAVQSEHAQKIIEDRLLPPSFTAIDDKRYHLRPEAIESVFVMYRISGNSTWADTAWRMFQAVEKATRTDIAAAAILDMTQDPIIKMDSMESYWLAETLKYFYLCFEDFETVSLDDYVLNTEAHPLKRPAR